MRESQTPQRREDAAQYKCIYCLQAKPAAHFRKREHIIPQAFGKFKESNPTLSKIVCDECNGLFGATIDEILAIDSAEGSARFQFGLRPDSAFLHRGTKTQTIRQLAVDPFYGAYFYLQYEEAIGKLTAYPITQIGVRFKGQTERKWFRAGEIPNYETILERVDLAAEQTYVVFFSGAEEKQLLLNEIMERQWPFVEKGDVHYEHSEGFIPCRTESIIDHERMRAIAKIAFNFLAYTLDVRGCGYHIFHSEFNAVRSYIRYGILPSEEVVAVKDRPLLHNEKDSDYRAFGHILTLELAAGQKALLAQVSIFNQFSYAVRLSDLFPHALCFESIGRFFNLHSRTVMSLDSCDLHEPEGRH